VGTSPATTQSVPLPFKTEETLNGCGLLPYHINNLTLRHFDVFFVPDIHRQPDQTTAVYRRAFMAGHGEKQSRKTEAAIAALLTSPSIEAAATAARVAEKTLRLWLKDQSFLSAYREARRRVLETAVGRMQQAAGGAVDALVRNLTCGRPGDEIKAAGIILQLGTQAVELMDVEERLAALEGRVSSHPNQPAGMAGNGRLR
jgi:hypothetical protein